MSVWTYSIPMAPKWNRFRPLHFCLAWQRGKGQDRSVKIQVILSELDKHIEQDKQERVWVSY